MPIILVTELALNKHRARRVTNFWGNWPSWGAPAPQTPRGGRAGDGMGWEQQRPRREAPRGRRRRRRPRCCSHPRPGPPGGLRGGSPPGRPFPPRVCYQPCWWPFSNQFYYRNSWAPVIFPQHEQGANPKWSNYGLPTSGGYRKTRNVTPDSPMRVPRPPGLKLGGRRAKNQIFDFFFVPPPPGVA